MEDKKYPILISEDLEGFNNSVNMFVAAMGSAIRVIKPLYESLNLDEPFDDETWLLMCNNPRLVRERYNKNLKKMADLIGITAGYINDSVLITNHPNVVDIENRMNLLPVAINNMNDQSNKLDPSSIINVNTIPELSHDAKIYHLEYFRFYIANDREAAIKITLDNFSLEYSRLLVALNNIGYGPNINSINNSYLSNLFTEGENYHLTTDPTAIKFLTRFTHTNKS
jgi:hypothetical protein